MIVAEAPMEDPQMPSLSRYSDSMIWVGAR